jgi:hypothetical protein
MLLSEGEGLPSMASVAAADVNRNGQNEIYALSRTGKITVLEMVDGEFELLDTFTIVSDFSFANLLIDDFDNDGTLELCAVEGNTSIKYSGGWLIRGWGSSSTLYFIEYTGNDYDVVQSVAIPNNSVFTSESADFDNDNRIEVVVGGTNGDLVFVERSGGTYVIDDVARFSNDEIICLDSGDTDADGVVEIGMSNDTGVFKIIGHDGSDYAEEYSSSTSFPIALEIGSVDSDPQEEVFVKGGFNFDMNVFKWTGTNYVEDAVLPGYEMVFDEGLVVGELVNKDVLVINSFSSSLLEHDVGYSQIWESGTLGANAHSSGIENVDSDSANDLVVAYKGNIFIYGTFGTLNPVLTVSDTNVEAGEQVVFYGSQSTGSGQLDYFFDFGDGTNSGWIGNSQTTHSYSSAGTYVATLRVRDQSGTQSPDVDSKTIFVSPSAGKPVAIIDSITPSPSLQGETVTFTGHGEGEGTIVDYEWSSNIQGFLGDSASIQYTGLPNGDHVISFKVRNDKGEWSDDTPETLKVSSPPEADIDSISPSTPNFGELVTFKGSGTDDGDIVGYDWSSNVDGFLSNQDTFSYSGLSAGAHIISLKVLDEDGLWSDDDSQSLYINEIPTATIESVDPDEGIVGDLIVLSGSGEDDGSISAYNWESDIDGFLSSRAEFSIFSLSAGVHTISFTVRDNRDVWSEPDTWTVTINEEPENLLPVAIIESVSPAKLKEGEEVSFAGSGMDLDGKIKEYFWESDLDGFLSDERTFTTDALSEGFHKISFSVRDDRGDWSEVIEVVVEVEEKEEESQFLGIDFSNFNLDSFNENTEMCFMMLIVLIIVILVIVAAVMSARKKRRRY